MTILFLFPCPPKMTHLLHALDKFELIACSLGSLQIDHTQYVGDQQEKGDIKADEQQEVNNSSQLNPLVLDLVPVELDKLIEVRLLRCFVHGLQKLRQTPLLLTIIKALLTRSRHCCVAREACVDWLVSGRFVVVLYEFHGASVVDSW